MEFTAKEIKLLRKEMHLTQEALGKTLGVSRQTVCSIEKGKAPIKAKYLQIIAREYEVSIQGLVSGDISWNKEKDFSSGRSEKKKDVSPHFVFIPEEDKHVPDKNKRELMGLVPIAAIAGYQRGFLDSNLVEGITTFDLPLQQMAKHRTHRIFQIQGDSMTPSVHDGDYIITVGVDGGLKNVKYANRYIVVTYDDIVYKRIFDGIESVQ